MDVPHDVLDGRVDLHIVEVLHFHDLHEPKDNHEEDLLLSNELLTHFLLEEQMHFLHRGVLSELPPLETVG
jgi:hypothetical protein